MLRRFKENRSYPELPLQEVVEVRNHQTIRGRSVVGLRGRGDEGQEEVGGEKFLDDART